MFYRICGFLSIALVAILACSILMRAAPPAPGPSAETPGPASGRDGTVDVGAKSSSGSVAGVQPQTRATAPKLDGGAVNRMLADLAKRQGQEPDDYLQYAFVFNPARQPHEHEALYSEKSRVLALRDKGVDYSLAVQSADAASCWDVLVGEQIVLFEPSGKILDHIQCMLDNRIGPFKAVVGSLTTEVHQEPEPDGAQLVIRFVPAAPPGPYADDRLPPWYHDQHFIQFHARDYGFCVNEEKAREAGKDAEPDVWAKKGLCRAKISGGKFVIIFPDLERPEERIRKAKSIKVTNYFAAGTPRSAVIDSSEEINELVAAVSVWRTQQFTPEIGRFGSSVEFILPSGAAMIIRFRSPTCLLLKDWGTIDLKSRTFHDKLCAILSKREGAPARLVDENGVAMETHPPEKVAP